jgi:hypothetical protein
MFVLQIVNPKKREHDLLGMGRLDRNALTRGMTGDTLAISREFHRIGRGGPGLLTRLFSERERRHRPCYALCDHVGGR